MGLAAKLSMVPVCTERRAERAEVDIDASLRKMGAFGTDVHVHNLSPFGFMVESDEIYQPGTYVWLKLPDLGGVNARVVWSDCFRYGCEFVTPLDPEVCSALIRRVEQMDN